MDSLIGKLTVSMEEILKLWNEEINNKENLMSENDLNEALDFLENHGYLKKIK